jgi:hypothetical protein
MLLARTNSILYSHFTWLHNVCWIAYGNPIVRYVVQDDVAASFCSLSSWADMEPLVLHSIKEIIRACRDEPTGL